MAFGFLRYFFRLALYCELIIYCIFFVEWELLLKNAMICCVGINNTVLEIIISNFVFEEIFISVWLKDTLHWSDDLVSWRIVYRISGIQLTYSIFGDDLSLEGMPIHSEQIWRMCEECNSNYSLFLKCSELVVKWRG